MFRAYASTSGEDKKEEEVNDNGDLYSSFDYANIQEARKEFKKGGRAEKKRSVEKVKVYDSLSFVGDLGSSVDEFKVISDDRIAVPVKKLKKKHSKKSKRHKKERKRKIARRDDTTVDEGDFSSESSSGSDLEQNIRRMSPKRKLRKNKWDFLASGEQYSKELSYVVFDVTSSHENFNMDCIPRRHTTEYKYGFYNILNGNERLDELFFSKELREFRQKTDRSERYFMGKWSVRLRNIDETTTERNFRVLPLLRETNSDFIPLSQSKNDEFVFLHEIEQRKDVEKQLYDIKELPGNIVALETRRREIATEFSMDSKNGDLLNQFLKVNEEIFDSSRAHGMAVDRRPLVERQISILDQAIASNPRMVEYRLKRLNFLKEIRPTKELLSEWEQILNTFVNNCSVWEKYLDFIQYDMALYESEIMDKAFDRCFSKLYAILSGTFRSHKPEKDTELFLLNTYVRRLKWWMECGFTNRAVASVQATFEYNFHRPLPLAFASEQEKMEAFAEFWNSGVPRFGDLEAKGWADYYSKRGRTDETCDFEIVGREAQLQQITQLEEKISSSSDGSVMSWVEMERELDNIESRPRRPLTGNYASQWSDQSLLAAHKEVTFEDIRILTSCDDNALFILLRLLGVQFDKSVSSIMFSRNNQFLTCAPTFQLLVEWNLLPPSTRMFTIPSSGARKIALNMIYAVIKLRPSMEFVISLLETKALQLDHMFLDKPTGIHVKKMRDFLDELMSFSQNIDISMSRTEYELTVAAYALNMFARWVREDDVNMVQEDKQQAGHEQKQKKRKIKIDREYTSSHYVEKLKELLFKITSYPVLLLGSVKRQILLRTLLSLVQAVPRSSVLGVITRVLLGKDDQKKLSPTDALAALEEWKQLFGTLKDFSKPLSCFESPRALCIALRIHFEYARASQHSDQWVEECESLFQLVDHCQTPDDRSVILCAYLDVLEHNWKHRHTLKSQLLITLEKGQNICPHDGSIIRRHVNIFSSWMRGTIRRIILSEVATDPTLDMYRALTYIYLAKHRAEELKNAGVVVNADMVARTIRSEASRKLDPALWRLAMAYANSKSFIDETHVLASAQCGWSRHLHIDYIATSGSRQKCLEVIKLMEERGAHVFNDLDYIEVLKQTNVNGEASVENLMDVT